MSKKKKPHQNARYKRMKKPQRLQSAKAWVGAYEGNQVIKAYRKRYGVDIPCAINELRLLGIAISEEYENRILASLKGQQEAKKRKAEQQIHEESSNFPPDSNEEFYFIIGYTSDGVPYGITWEEARRENMIDEDEPPISP